MNTNIHQLCQHENKRDTDCFDRPVPNNVWYCPDCESIVRRPREQRSAGPLDEHIENPSFDDLWALWPKDRRGAKQSCKHLYGKTLAGFTSKVRIGDETIPTFKCGTHAEIFEGAQAYLKAKEGKFLYLLETFLNKGAWEQ